MSNKMALDALKFAEAALADIGDADREPGDDLAWCEARAAEALPQTRAAIAALEAEPQDGDVEQALNRMDALLDPSLNLLAVSENSITLQGCRADMLTIRRALRMAPAAREGWQPIETAPTEAPQEFESAQGRALASAWAEGWTQCRDAEYAGEEAQSEAFNQSYTLAQCLHADQTRLQGGLSNDQLRRAWGAKLPRVIPTDEQLTAFALGIEVAVAQSAPLAQQAREYPPLPKLPTMTVLSELQSGTQEMVRLDVAHEAMRAYVDADRAAAHVEPPAGRVIPADGEVRG